MRSHVLPIGGLKEKMLAAKPAGVMTVTTAEKNQQALARIPREIKEGMNILAFKEAEDVLRELLQVNSESFLKGVPNLKGVEGTPGQEKRSAMSNLG